MAKKATLAEPPVVPTPDVLEIAREANDEFLVIASDGLWVWPGTHCLPRHRMPFDSRNQGSTCVE